jgi:hypothetical protein
MFTSTIFDKVRLFSIFDKTIKLKIFYLKSTLNFPLPTHKQEFIIRGHSHARLEMFQELTIERNRRLRTLHYPHAYTGNIS